MLERFERASRRVATSLGVLAEPNTYGDGRVAVRTEIDVTVGFPVDDPRPVGWTLILTAATEEDCFPSGRSLFGGGLSIHVRR